MNMIKVLFIYLFIIVLLLFMTVLLIYYNSQQQLSHLNPSQYFIDIIEDFTVFEGKKRRFH